MRAKKVTEKNVHRDAWIRAQQHQKDIASKHPPTSTKETDAYWESAGAEMLEARKRNCIGGCFFTCNKLHSY